MKPLLILFICLFLGLNVKSQTTASLQITGKVSDSIAKKPISFATILLKNDKKVQIKSVVSAKDGSFSITGIAAGNYSLSIVYVGYQAKVVPVQLKDASKNLETIALSPS